MTFVSLGNNLYQPKAPFGLSRVRDRKPHAMAKQMSNAPGPVHGLSCFGAIEFGLHSFSEQLNPSVKMFFLNRKPHVFLHRVALVRFVTQQQGSPEVIHRRQMCRPVYMRKNRGEQIITANLIVETVHQCDNIFPGLNVFP